jgi:hypothetical protein
MEGGTASIDHPVVWALTLHREKLPVGDVVLVIYDPEEHSADAEKLQLLSASSPPVDPPNAGIRRPA